MSTQAPSLPRGRFEHLRVPNAPVPFIWTRQDTQSTLLIAILALITRFIGLSSATASNTPVFDEKHYVPQAWDIVESWLNPLTGGIESNPGYGLVVHPPLAKQIEAFGEMIFGYTPLGWRVMSACFGVVTVLLIMAIARRLSHSTVVASFAGILALFDGVLLVTSRFGMLDIFQVTFIVAAAWALIHDHQQMDKRLYTAWVEQKISTHFGPRLGFRWWRFTCGVFLGLSLSVKWSGLYYMAFFGLLAVGMDYLLRRKYGVPQAFIGTLVRDAFAAFASLVLLPVALYIWSWRAWFAEETSVYRHALSNGTISSDGFLAKLPEPIAGWLYYHSSVLEFHASLTSSSGHSHPWDSKPWAWLAAVRPILYYSVTDVDCEGECRRMIYLFGTPAIWWLTVPIMCWALWSLIIRKDLRYLVPVVTFLAGFLPWLAAYDRQMYFFYATALVPFTIVMISLALGDLVAYGKKIRFKKLELTTGSMIVIGYLALVAAMFVYFSALFYGYPIPNSFYEDMMWLPSWR